MEKAINTTSLDITKKLREALKLELSLTNASEVEFNRAAHIFFLERFIKYLTNEKDIKENKPFNDTYTTLDIVDTNLLIAHINTLFDDEVYDDMMDIVDKHEEALLDILDEDEMEDSLFEY